MANTELENWQINFEMKQAKRELFNDDPTGCYVPVTERCKCCLEIFDESDIKGGLCEFCHNELSNPTQ